MKEPHTLLLPPSLALAPAPIQPRPPGHHFHLASLRFSVCHFQLGQTSDRRQKFQDIRKQTETVALPSRFSPRFLPLFPVKCKAKKGTGSTHPAFCRQRLLG